MIREKRKMLSGIEIFKFFVSDHLKGEFLRVWENFAPPPGIGPSLFAPGQGIRQKNLPGWPGFARSKKFSRGGCTQLELTET